LSRKDLYTLLSEALVVDEAKKTILGKWRIG
jgi:hypothetical protein